MQKYAKRVDPHPTGDGRLAGAINIAGPDDDVRGPEPLTVLRDDFILFDFREAISFAPELGARLNRARFI